VVHVIYLLTFLVMSYSDHSVEDGKHDLLYGYM